MTAMGGARQPFRPHFRGSERAKVTPLQLVPPHGVPELVVGEAESRRSGALVPAAFPRGGGDDGPFVGGDGEAEVGGGGGVVLNDSESLGWAINKLYFQFIRPRLPRRSWARRAERLRGMQLGGLPDIPLDAAPRNMEASGTEQRRGDPCTS